MHVRNVTKDDDKRAFLELAERAFSDLQRQKEASQAKTIGELWDAWALSAEFQRRARHRRGHRRYLTIPCVLEGETFAVQDLKWTDFTVERVDAWKKAMATTPTSRKGVRLSAASRDQIRLGLQGCFTYHLRHTRLVTSNPLSGIPLEETSPTRRQGYFTPDSLAAYLRHCRPILAAMLRISARCGGLRRDEIRLLRKEQIDHHGKKLIVRNKGGGEKRVLITEDAYKELMAWVQLSPGVYVFPKPSDPTGNTPVPSRNISRWMAEASASSGVKLQGETPVFHHARHGYAMAMAKKAPLPWVAQQLGHKGTKQLEQRYALLRGEDEEQMRTWAEESPLGGDPKKPEPK